MISRKYIKKFFSESQRHTLNNFLRDLKAFGKRDKLNELARIYGTDKYGLHFYTTHYNEHFKKYKNKRFSFLEIGVGGHDDPKTGGNSLRMWKKYFSKATINSIDIFDKSFLQEKRINIFKGSQVDKNFLTNLIAKIGNPQIIIDDGSHVNEHVIETFKILFPLLKEDGIYAIEDTQTSYWPEFGGDSKNLNNPSTIQNYFKQLTDCINYEELVIDNYEPSYYDKNICSIHFYHNLIFIYKGNNKEGSNKNIKHKVHT